MRPHTLLEWPFTAPAVSAMMIALFCFVVGNLVGETFFLGGVCRSHYPGESSCDAGGGEERSEALDF